MLAMSWLYLIVAAIFEIGWPLGFKLSTMHPAHRVGWILFATACMALSGIFLYLAQRTIPIATAYIVWTGAGAVFTFLLGVVLFGDALTALRLLFAGLILAGVIGLELTTRH